jgi:hypothetical protein
MAQSKVFLVHTCNVWHQRNSYELIAVADTKAIAINMVRAHADKQGETISEDNLHLLETINQTQGHEGENEYIIEAYSPNTLF